MYTPPFPPSSYSSLHFLQFSSSFPLLLFPALLDPPQWKRWRYFSSISYTRSSPQAMMVSLCRLSISRPYIVASCLPTEPSPSLPQTPNSLPKSNNSTRPQFYQQQKLQRKQRKPTITEIEKAIGAGIFREDDTNRESNRNKSLFENILKDEGAAEKKLRETGEWMVDQSERSSRSLGKPILETLFLLVIPLWISAFLIASGLIKLPFSTPFLDDLVS